MSKFPYYNQHDVMDCGPTCLRMIAKHYGKAISINNLRNQSQYSREGVSLLGINKAAEGIGFKTLAANLTVEDLKTEAPLPCILHWNQNHFVVLYKATKNKFTIADPAKNLLVLNQNEFIHNWISNPTEQKGIALLLEPTATFYNQIEEKNKGLGWGLLTNYLLKYKAQIFQLLFSAMGHPFSPSIHFLIN